MVTEVFLVALLTDVATGLGVLPLAFLDHRSPRWPGLAAGFAGGMMLSASVFALADKALRRGSAAAVVGGMLAGAAFFAMSARIIATRHWQLHGWSESASRRSIVVIATMFVHSIPEGIAIGV